jgi:hypothetical protein
MFYGIFDCLSHIFQDFRQLQKQITSTRAILHTEEPVIVARKVLERFEHAGTPLRPPSKEKIKIFFPQH